jgi:hypothetical protein
MPVIEAERGRPEGGGEMWCFVLVANGMVVLPRGNVFWILNRHCYSSPPLNSLPQEMNSIAPCLIGARQLAFLLDDQNRCLWYIVSGNFKKTKKQQGHHP